jgi:hypothetical protein
MIVLKIAELPIGIDNKYPRIANMAKDYLTNEEPLFVVSVTEEEIDGERIASNTDYPRSYYESIIAYRKIAEKLPEYDAFLFHGSVIEVDNKAYVITANSGVGKTTHTRLWMGEFPGKVSILNGDKPILRIINGKPYACGTPWQGKENYGKNAVRELCGFAFLTRAAENKAYKISEGDAVMRFMTQIYLPKSEKSALLKTMQLANRVIGSVKLVMLECNMNPEAAHVCRRALIGD